MEILNEKLNRAHKNKNKYVKLMFKVVFVVKIQFKIEEN